MEKMERGGVIFDLGILQKNSGALIRLFKRMKLIVSIKCSLLEKRGI